MYGVLVVATPGGLLSVHAGGFLRAGVPHRIVSGALHYFRIHPALWRDRLERVRALGLNTVETYVPWNLHERRRGDVRFDGWTDLPEFVRLAGGLGLDVIVRPGPYICAEWDFGGLPAWLLADGPARLRCNDPDFRADVAQWFDDLIPRLAALQSSRGGPVVAVQVENEYGSYGDDLAYLRFCRDALTERGIDVLLVTSDGAGPDYLASGTVDGAVPTVNFGSRAAESFAELRAFDASAPLMCMELWNGWFDHWGEPHHTRDPRDAAGLLDAVLAEGASVNLYMAHGGTSFGLWSGANLADGEYQPTVGSYDYDAAVGEAGELTAKFHAFRRVIERHTGACPPAPPGEPARLAPDRADVDGWASLWSCLPAFDEPVSAPVPLSMEELGQDHGLVLYRGSVLVPPGGEDLRLDDLADRAVVLADGLPVGVVSRNDPDPVVRLEPSPDGRRTALDVLVENQGRVNYGPAMGERKGVRAVRLGRRLVHGWRCQALRLDDPRLVERLQVEEPTPPATGPTFARTSFDVAEPADGFLALPGWGKGFVWLNGFLLGRYWSVGPQRTLYAPTPLWHTGRNEVTVLELHQPGSYVELRDQPDLGGPS